MDEATEATEATEETMEAAEEVTAATADPAGLGQARGASSLVVSHIQAGTAKENDTEALQRRPQRL